MTITLCPICRKPSISEQKPFCSSRCREVDLGRWFGEDYKLPAEDPLVEDPVVEDGE